MTEAFLVAELDSAGLPGPGAARDPVIWWSVTKPVIATAALRLVAEGRLSLDVPLPGESFALRHLLAHRAGLGDYGRLPAYGDAVALGASPWTFGEMRIRVDAAEPPGPPGAAFRYSNLGYALVGRAIEAASGLPLAHALATLVLEPLGCRGTRLATAPADLADTALPPPPGYHPGHVHHGVLVGPVSEAAAAVRGCAGGLLLPPELGAALRAREALPFGPTPGRPWITPGYGLGVMDGTMRDGASGREFAAVGHSAGGPGSAGAVYLRADTGRTVAVFGAQPSEGPAETLAAALLARDTAATLTARPGIAPPPRASGRHHARRSGCT